MAQSHTTSNRRSTHADTRAEAATYASGPLVDEGAFINLISAIQSIHLNVWVTVANSGTLRQESISLADERTLVHAAGRLFAKGDAQEAAKQIRQAQNGFNRKKAEWESRVRQSEDDSSRRRAMRELQQKKGNHNPISARIPPAENQCRRLIEALELHVSQERTRELALRRESSKAASQVSAQRRQRALPSGFLEAFSSAASDRQETVLRQFFDVEAELTVAAASQDADPMDKMVTITPQLPKNRLYYLVEAAQVIRLRRVKITDVVHYHNYATQRNETMSLPLFIDKVRAGGVWLLRAKSGTVQANNLSGSPEIPSDE